MNFARPLLNLPNKFLKHILIIQMNVSSVDPNRIFLAIHHWTNPLKKTSWYPLIVMYSQSCLRDLP